MQGACKVPGPDTLNEVALIAESIELEESLGSVGGWKRPLRQAPSVSTKSHMGSRSLPSTQHLAGDLLEARDVPQRGQRVPRAQAVHLANGRRLLLCRVLGALLLETGIHEPGDLLHSGAGSDISPTSNHCERSGSMEQY